MTQLVNIADGTIIEDEQIIMTSQPDWSFYVDDSPVVRERAKKCARPAFFWSNETVKDGSISKRARAKKIGARPHGGALIDAGDTYLEGAWGFYKEEREASAAHFRRVVANAEAELAQAKTRLYEARQALLSLYTADAEPVPNDLYDIEADVAGQAIGAV